MTDADQFEAVLKSVREFVTEKVIPREDEIESTDAVPEEIRQAAIEMGLFGYALPQEHGGLGFNAVEDVRLAMEFGRTAPAFRSMFGTNNGIAGQTLVHAGTPRQQEAYLPRLAQGAVASFALTEPEAGSDPSGLRTTARRDGDDYVLNGAKRFITNAPLAELLIVFARTGAPEDGTKGISVFVVEAGTPGITIAPKDKKMGQKGAWTSDVYFDDARTPAATLIGEVEGGGFKAAMRSLSKGRLHISGICVGMAERLIAESVTFANEQRQGGRPIARFQLVQALIAESYAEAAAGRAMVLAAAEKYDRDEETRIGPASTKLFCSEMVDRVADRAVQVHGGSGYMADIPVERFYRDSRLFRIYEGTSEIQKLVIARELLGT